MVVIEGAFDCLVNAIVDDDIDEEVNGGSETLYEGLSDRSSVQFRSILNIIFDTVIDMALRSRLIQNIPAFSSRLALFRRRLSLAFFCEDSDYLSKPLQDLVNLGSISHRLTAPKFVMNRETNYTELAASISFLNVGVDCGDPPLAGIDKNADNTFNEEVDELSYRVKSMSTRIIDTGASQLKKTEAKEVLESFNFRLMYAVRTRPKPKTTIFGSSDMDQSRKITDFMKEWQAKKEQAAAKDTDDRATIAV